MIKTGLRVFDQNTVEGWAINTEAPDETLPLDLFINDEPAGTVVPELYRPDVASVFGGQGVCGFRVVMDRKLSWGAVISLRREGSKEIVGTLIAPDVPSRQEYSSLYKLYETDIGPLLLNKNDITLDAKIISNKCWSPDEQVVMGRLLEATDGDFFDIGANLGYCSVAGSKHMSTDRRILSFEPQDSVFKRLCANLAINNVHNAMPIRSLLWSKADANIEIELVDPLWLGSSGGARAVPGQTSLHAAPVETLDSWASGFQVSLIKIDCEGAELEILKGAKKTLELQRPFLYFECNVSEKSKAILSLLFEFEYSLYWHSPLVNRTTPSSLSSVESENCSLNVIAIPVEKLDAFQLLDGISQISSIESSDEYWPANKVGQSLHAKALSAV
ncbi:MAG: FkbM family methyltransferase [Pseudomonadota bacterium]